MCLLEVNVVFVFFVVVEFFVIGGVIVVCEFVLDFFVGVFDVLVFYVFDYVYWIGVIFVDFFVRVGLSLDVFIEGFSVCWNVGFVVWV